MGGDERRGSSRSRNESDRFEALLAAYIDRLLGGEILDMDEIVRDEPEFGPELVSHLEMYQGLNADRPAAPAIGMLGDFSLVREVGRGGMGVVYEAWQSSMNRRVALKVLPQSIAADGRSCARFMREAQAAGRLRHRNVVSVHAMGIDNRTPYYAMDFLEGETLAHILKRLKAAGGEEPGRRDLVESVTRLFKTEGQSAAAESTQQSLATAATTERLADGLVAPAFETEGIDLQYCLAMARAFAGVAEGLQHAHTQGVIHRDIKPSNLMLDRDGELRILDFGLAHLEGQESLTLSGDVVGTPLYMSPEQAKARSVPIDHRTDVYSLGATLYEALTLRPPFTGKSHYDTLSQIVAHDPPPLRKRNPRIPKDLETIVLKCLMKDPADRYGTAEALAQDLRRLARGDPIEARPQSRLERLARQVRRHRWRLAAAAVALLLAGAAAVLGLLYRGSQARHARVFYHEQAIEAALELQREHFLGQPDYGEVDLFGHEVSAAARYFLPQMFMESADELSATGDGRSPLLAKLDQAIAGAPNRPEAYYYKAKALRLLNRQAEARAALELALERNPHFAPARLLLKDLATGRAEREAHAARLQAHSHLPESWQSRWVSAHGALKARRWDDAIRGFESLYGYKDADGELYEGASVENLLAYGKALMGAKDFHGAIRIFSAAHDRWRAAAEPSILLARAYLEAGLDDEADRVFEVLHARRQPDGAAALISTMYISFRRLRQARSWSDRIADPALRACTAAATHLMQNDVPQAEAKARDAIVSNDALPWAHALLGVALVRQGRAVDAQRDFQRSIELDGRYAPGFVGLGHTFHLMGKTEESVAAFRTAIDLDPALIEGYVEYVGVLIRQENLAQAEELCLCALEQRPDVPALRTALGYVYYAVGRAEDALRELDASLKLQPKQPAAHHYLGLIYAEVDRPKMALQHLGHTMSQDPYEQSSSRDVIELLAREELPGCEEELKGFIEYFDGQRSTVTQPEAALTLAAAVTLASLQRGSLEDLARAARIAEERIAAARGGDPDMLATLGRIHWRANRRREAVLALEAAARLPREMRASKMCFQVEDRLAQYRGAVFPLIPSYESADAAIAAADTVPLVPQGAEWRYAPGIAEPSSEPGGWVAGPFEDAAWSRGASPFGYPDVGRGTPARELKGRTTTLYARTRFDAGDPARFSGLTLRVWTNAGAVAYLNGTELARVRVAKDRRWLPSDVRATWGIEHPLVPVEIEVPPGALARGENILAMQGLCASRHQRTLYFLATLDAMIGPDPARDEELCEKVRNAARPEDEGRVAYIEGRVLARRGRHGEAAAKFRRAIEVDGGEPLPRLRLAESKLAAGDPAGAEETLRAALAAGAQPARALWDSWIAVCLTKLGQTPAQIIERYPPFEAEADSTARDTAWVMEQLAAGTAIRINCGGRDYTGADGKVWSGDRCYREGEGFWPRVAPADGEGVADFLLYRSHRHSWKPPGMPIYRIPLPPGRYRVTLHFAEFVHGVSLPGERRFDVFLEGARVLEDYLPPPRKPEKRTFDDVSVEDGHLDIGYAAGSAGVPMISALEIEVADGQAGAR